MAFLGIRESDGKNRTLYSLRHTYATERLKAGVQVYWLAEHMGTSVDVIQNYYGHVMSRMRADHLTQRRPGEEQPDWSANLSGWSG